MTRNRVAAVVLAVLATVLPVLGLTGRWVHEQVADTDRYVRTVAPLAADPAIQDALADRLAAVNDRLDVQDALADVVPPRAEAASFPVAEAIRSFVDRTAHDITTSDAFGAIWERSQRRAHARLVAVLTGDEDAELVAQTGDGTVVVDLEPLADRLRVELTESGLPRVARTIGAPRPIEVAASSGVADARHVLDVFDRARVLVAIATLLSLAGVVFLAPDWRRGLVRAALCLATGMALLLLAYVAGRGAYLDEASAAGVRTDVAQAFFDTLLRGLRRGAAALLAFALVVATLAAVSVRRDHPRG